MIRRILAGERKHLLRIGSKARALLLSFVVYSACWPLISTFGGAYIWRTNQSLELLVAFNIGIFVAVPIGFYGNAILMQQYPVARLYSGGFLGIGAAMLLFVFSGASELWGVGLGGFTVGLFLGLYWASRVLLTLNLTNNRERDLFFAIDTMVATAMGVAMPAIFGIFIQHRFFLPDTFDEQGSYRTLLLFAFVAFLVGAYRISRMNFQAERPAPIWCRDKSRVWRSMSVVMLCRGFADSAVWIMPIVLPLQVFGGEGSLGGVQSASAIVIAVFVYFVGRAIQVPSKRLQVLLWAVVGVHVAALPLLCGVTQTSVVLFGLLNGLSTALIWLTLNPIVFSAIEHLEESPTERLGYICHRELTLNLGRIVGSLLFVMSLQIADAAPMTWIALPFAASQIVLLYAAKRGFFSIDGTHGVRMNG
jgi:YQGE family putative transporter